MSEDITFTHYSAFQITQKGMELRQRAIAGGEAGGKINVDFTRGAIGQGRPSPDTDIYYMTGLVDHAADVPIKESYARETNHIMVIVIDGLKLTKDIIMTEIGIYARLVDAVTGKVIIPELLYGYTFTQKYDYIPAGSSYNLHREIAFDTILSREGKFKIVFDKDAVYVTQKEFDGHILMHPLIDSLNHGLNGYPDITVIESDYGYGVVGYGEGPYGGSVSRRLDNRITYLDRNHLSLSVEKKYNEVKSITRVSAKEYIVSFADCTLSLLILLRADDAPGSGSGTGGYPEYAATDAEVEAMVDSILGR